MEGLRIIQQILVQQSTGMVIVLKLPTQAWYSHLTRVLIDIPFLLPCASSKSKARIKGLSLAMINRSAGWTCTSTLRKVYNKPIQSFEWLL